MCSMKSWHYRNYHISRNLQVHPVPIPLERPPDDLRPPRRSERILGKRPPQRLLAADLLARDEAVHRDGDGTVNVRLAAVLAQAHLGEGGGQAHYGFQVADLFLGKGWLV